ncbi:MAG: sulfatase, partial [Actinomycetota bacterium]|nr:sulfatase [Actinomycetota bacterium]
MRPNVLCVVLDAARRDALEPYGAAAGSTPVIADLARRGTALPHAYAAGCWTLPSHASMFTGLLPRATGLADVPGPGPHSARPVMEMHRERLLPEVMRRAGYATAAVSANSWVAGASGFDIGFDRFRAIDTGRHANLHRDDLRSRVAWTVEATRGKVDDGAREAQETLAGWLRDPGDPFFWFVNLIDCHSPYLPPRPYNDLGLRDRLRAARENREYLTMGMIWRAAVGVLDVPDDALERMRHLYARSIRYLDDWLGTLLERMDAAGVLDDTLVLVLSDHGENLGEHGRLAHVMSLDDRLLAVPLVAAGPGAPRDAGVTSLAALPRLIAEATGIDGPWSADDLPAGAAVAQCDPVLSVSEEELAAAAERWDVPLESLDALTIPQTAATDGALKLHRVGDREVLYDLESDPG